MVLCRKLCFYILYYINSLACTRSLKFRIWLVSGRSRRAFCIS
uniref:Uncharacterized protein n=1 Tax=Anguilla anguilla TaxID=7936 RepID=A0A0E9UEI0_ANGAN